MVLGLLSHDGVILLALSLSLFLLNATMAYTNMTEFLGLSPVSTTLKKMFKVLVCFIL